jgi:serine/threonine protein kinase
MTNRAGQQLGNYRLTRLLGRGGFADVYLDEHVYLNKPAALKVLHLRLGEQETEQFLREAQTLARLEHPHIVRVLDFAVQDGLPFLVMDYALGEPCEQSTRRALASPSSKSSSISARWPPPCNTPMTSASCTATSSRKICCWTLADGSCWPTLGWRCSCLHTRPARRRLTRRLRGPLLIWPPNSCKAHR